MQREIVNSGDRRLVGAILLIGCVIQLAAASLVDPTKATGAEGGVDLVENGIRLTVSGNGKIPLDDLVRVAESIPPIPSPSPSGGTPVSTG